MENFKIEILTLQEGCGFDESTAAHLRLKGPDTTTFLHRLLTNNVQKLPIGGIQWNALCDRKGKVKTLFQLIKCSEEGSRIIAEKETLQKTEQMLTSMIFVDQVNISNESDQHHLFLLVGPMAKKILSERWNEIPTEPFRLKYATEEMTFFWFEDLYDQPIWYVMTTTKSADNIREYFLKKATPISSQAIELVRIEAGIPKYGVDMTEENILLEGNLQHAYARQKGCYPGQEIIERLHTYADGKTPKVITKVEVNGNTPIEGATSSLFNPLSGKTVGLVKIKREQKKTPDFNE